MRKSAPLPSVIVLANPNTLDAESEPGSVQSVDSASSTDADRGRIVDRWFPPDWRRDVALLVLLTAGLLVLHLMIPGVVPSGGDGGNWLALAADRFGNGAMAADVSYPPLLPFLLGLIELLSGDEILAITTVALVSKATLVVATYVATRTLTRWYAFVAAVIVATGGYLLEAYAWGGYPQILAMGLGLLGSFFVIRYLGTQRRVHLWVGLLLCAATLLTHTMVGGLLGASLLIAVLHYLYMTDPRPGPRKRLLKVGLTVAGSVLVLAALGYLWATAGGLEATINPIGLSRIEALTTVVQEAPYPWLVIAVLGIGVLFFRYWAEQVASTVAVGFSWALSSAVLFAVSGEPRALMVTQVGMVLLAMVGLASLLATLRTYRGWKAVLHPLAVIVGVALVASLATSGVTVYDAATDWYRVVDRPEIASLDRLSSDSQPGDLVLAATGHHGNPLGWWVQGYADRPAFTAMSPDFLAFPDEREQAELANRFFSGDMDEQESIDLIEEHGVRYIVVDKRHSDSSWLETELAKSFDVLDNTSNIVVLRVPAASDS